MTKSESGAFNERSIECDPLLNATGMLTATGRGAVAVVAVWGPGVSTTIDELFGSVSKKRLSKQSGQCIFYGVWKSTGEDVVVVRPAGFKKANSAAWEVHCHGGTSAPRSVLDSFSERGFRELNQSEIARRIQGGNWRSELAVAMTRALTETTARQLLHQYSIADHELNRICSLLESDPSGAESELIDMLNWSDFGLHLTTPWTVVFCGEPNVGKSSLVNAIVGFNRAIVHETAGTTRDVVSQVTAIHGWPVEIKDTAGLRDTTDAIEQKGIELGEAEIRNADLVVAVHEAHDFSKQNLPGVLAKRKPDLYVYSKADLCKDRQSAALPSGALLTSVEDGTGIPELVNAIGAVLIKSQPPAGRLVPCTQRQVDLVQAVLKLLRAGNRLEAAGLLNRDSPKVDGEL